MRPAPDNPPEDLPEDLLRPIAPADHAAVLAWNEHHVELLSPLDDARLVELLGWSHRGCVIRDDGVDVGFVLTFAAGAPYDSPYYQWFSERRSTFLYLDRIVIDAAVRRSGLGTRVYDALEAHARTMGPVLFLEVNLDPPNEPSLAFHRNRGYREVGRKVAGDRVVSLMEKDLVESVQVK